jgi:hypothetical protein
MQLIIVFVLILSITFSVIEAVASFGDLVSESILSVAKNISVYEEMSSGLM